MDEYIFLDKSKPPGEIELNEKAPLSNNILNKIKNYLTSRNISVTEEWKYYSKKTGWTKKILMNKRNLLFFTPCISGPNISFVFGDKAVLEINNSKLPQKIKDEITSAKKYAEGRGLRLQPRTRADVKTIIALLEIKIRIIVNYPDLILIHCYHSVQNFSGPNSMYLYLQNFILPMLVNPGRI